MISEKETLDIIQSIYDSEIPCRLEWLFDGGFVWSIQNSDYPRLWKDDDIEGTVKIVWESEKSMLLRNNPLLEKDWMERGNNYSFRDAVKELANAVCRNYPECDLAKWYDNNN